MTIMLKLGKYFTVNFATFLSFGLVKQTKYQYNQKLTLIHRTTPVSGECERQVDFFLSPPKKK